MAAEPELVLPSDPLTALHLELVKRRIRSLAMVAVFLTALSLGAAGVGTFNFVHLRQQEKRKNEALVTLDKQFVYLREQDKRRDEVLATLGKQVAELERQPKETPMQPRKVPSGSSGPKYGGGFQKPPRDSNLELAGPSQSKEDQAESGTRQGQEAEVASLSKQLKELEGRLEKHERRWTSNIFPETEITNPKYPEYPESNFEERLQALSVRIEALEQQGNGAGKTLGVLSGQLEQLKRRVSHSAVIREGRSTAALPDIGLAVQAGRVGKNGRVALKVWGSARQTRDVEVELDRPQSFELAGDRYEVTVRRVVKAWFRRDLLEVSLSRIP